jgi:hypothetical protein
MKPGTRDVRVGYTLDASTKMGSETVAPNSRRFARTERSFYRQGGCAQMADL